MPTTPGDDTGIIDSLRKPDTFFCLFSLCADLFPEEVFSFLLTFHWKREMCCFLPSVVQEWQYCFAKEDSSGYTH